MDRLEKDIIIKELTKIVENLGWVPDKKQKMVWDRGIYNLTIWVFNINFDNEKPPCLEYNFMVYDIKKGDDKDGYVFKDNTLDYDEFKDMITKYQYNERRK